MKPLTKKDLSIRKQWLKEEIKAYWIREEHYNHTQGRVDLKNLNMLIDEAFQIQEKGGLNGKDN